MLGVDSRPYAKTKQAANGWPVEYTIQRKNYSIQMNMTKNIFKNIKMNIFP